MYDELGGEKVKVFYQPLLELNKKNPEDSTLYYSMGRLRSFDIGDVLPLTEMWYKYPQDFLIYDYRGDIQDVWIIRQGAFFKFTSLDVLKEEEIVGPIYDYYGTELTIQTLAEMRAIKKADQRLTAEKRALFTRYQDFLCSEEEYEATLHTMLDSFTTHWFAPDVYHLEKRFGSFFECLLHATHNSNTEEVQTCILVLKNMQKEHPTIVETFKQWCDNSKVTAFDFNQLFL